MNKLIVIPVILLLLVATAHYFVVRNVEDVETQKYSIEEKDGEFEIRSYASRIVATTPVRGTFDAASSEGFKKLAGYIFGANQEEEKISMTAPVWMSSDTQSSIMQFIMPAKYNMNDLPEPNDSTVNLERFSGGRYAAITFGGFANDEMIAAHKKILTEWLENKGYPTNGSSYFLGYNSPFKIKHRRNEVLISID